MTFTLRDVRTNEKLIDTEYSRKESATRSYRTRLYTPQTAYIADESWREREAARKDLINLELFGLIPKPDHFLHVSVKSTYEEFLVSYTENPVKGSKNIQASGRKIGRYLTEFYPEVDANAIGHAIIAKVNDLGVNFAVTPEEIEAIYTSCDNRDSISSCMSHPRTSYTIGRYDRNLHPVQAYGNSDLQLAYIRNKSGDVSARVLVWPEKKHYSQAYGSDSIKLRGLLEKAGYKLGSFAGAKLNKIDITDKITKGAGLSPHTITYLVAPYLDRDRYCYLDDNDNLVISSRDVNGAQCPGAGSGYVQFQRMVDAVTGEKLTPSTACAVYDPVSGATCYVHVSHLTERSMSMPDGYRYALRDPNSSDVWITIDGAKMCLRYVSRHYVKDAIDGKWINPSQAMDTNDGSVSMEHFIKLYARCEITSEVHRRTSLVWMEHGAWWTRRAFTRRGGLTIDGKNYAIDPKIGAAA